MSIVNNVSIKWQSISSMNLEQLILVYLIMEVVSNANTTPLRENPSFKIDLHTSEDHNLYSVKHTKLGHEPCIR